MILTKLKSHFESDCSRFPSIFTSLSKLFMKNIFTPLFLIMAFQTSHGQVNSFLQKNSWCEIWNRDDDEEDSPFDPGWYQQYFEMKKNSEGKIQRLPFDNIRAQQAGGGLRDNLLFNIQELGPFNKGGRTRAVLVDRANDQHLLVGSVSGGLFTSNDAGAHWTTVNDEMSTLSISSLAQDYFKNEIIYAGTGEGWGNADGVIGNGVYRSEDNGTSFIQLPSTNISDFDYVFKVATSPADSNSLYVATGSGKLFRSFNNGDSMKVVFKGSNAISDIKITPAGGVWIAEYFSGIFYSATGDSGTFTAMNSGLPLGSMRRIQFDIAASDTMILYAVAENSNSTGLEGVYKSIDYGQSWNALINPGNVGFSTNQAWYDLCIGIKPDDPNFVVLGINDLVYTHDGGNQWLACANIHPDHHVILFHPENPAIFYEGNDGGIYRYNTSSMYLPHSLNYGYRTIQYYAGFYYPSGLNMTAGSQDNGTDKCKAGDTAFFFIYGGDGAYCAVNQQFPDVVYASYQNGNIARAFDGTEDVPSFSGILNELDGNGDGKIDEGAWFIDPYTINLVNGDYLGIVTLKRYWETFDGGASWQPAMNQIPSGSPFAIGMSRDFSPTVYVGGSGALFYRIDDVYDSQAGDEVNLSSKVPSIVGNDFISCITVHPDNDSVCYVSFSNSSSQPRVWKVTNAKTSNPVWTSISGDLPQGLPVNYIDVDPARPDQFFLAATDYGLYVSDNGGVNWYKQDAIPNVFTEQVMVRPGDRRVFVFTHGRGAFTATLDSLDVGIPSIAQQDFHPVIFPNPCSDELNIKSQENNFTVTIRNMNDQVVMDSRTIHQNETMDVSSFASGMYLVEMNDGKNLVVKKLMKE